MIRTAKELHGVAVVGAGGRMFGRVQDVQLDDATMKIAGVIVGLQAEVVAELGVHKPFWSRAVLTVPAADVEAISDVIVLRLSVEQFADRIGAATPEDP